MFKKNFFLCVLIFSLAILFYSLYKSEYIHQGEIRNYYLKYYYLSLLIFLFSLISLALKKKTKIYISIFFFSFLVTFYLFEFYLFNLEPTIKKKVQIYEKQTKQKYDLRTPREVLQDESKKDKSSTMQVSPYLYLKVRDKDLFPLSGISLSNTITVNENGYYFIYKSDRYGFNIPDEEWEENKIEFLMIGDSFVQGGAVNRPNDMASVLRELSKKHVINLGYGGNGPLIELATLKEYFPYNRKVKNILWFYYEGNDIYNLNQELKDPKLTLYLKDKNFSQNLNKKQDKIDEQNNFLIQQSLSKIEDKKIRENNKIFEFIKLFKTRTFLKELSKHLIKPKLPTEFKDIIYQAKDFAEKHDANFYFIYLPKYQRYSLKLNFNNYEEIKNTILDMNINFIDIHEGVFLKQTNPLELFPFQMYGHYNELGHKKVAEFIYKSIK